MWGEQLRTELQLKLEAFPNHTNKVKLMGNCLIPMKTNCAHYQTVVSIILWVLRAIYPAFLCAFEKNQFTTHAHYWILPNVPLVTLKMIAYWLVTVAHGDHLFIDNKSMQKPLRRHGTKVFFTEMKLVPTMKLLRKQWRSQSTRNASKRSLTLINCITNGVQVEEDKDDKVKKIEWIQYKVVPTLKWKKPEQASRA